MKTVLITGNTYPVKEQLKALRGRWDAEAKGWKVPEDQAEAAKAIVAGAPVVPFKKGNNTKINVNRRCNECGKPSGKWYRCYECSLEYREGGGMYAKGQSYRDSNGNFVLGDDD